MQCDDTTTHNNLIIEIFDPRHSSSCTGHTAIVLITLMEAMSDWA